MYFWAIESNVNLINMYLFNSYCMQWDAYVCCMRWSASKKGVSYSALSDSLWPHGLYPASLLCPWNSPGKNTSVGSHSLLQGLFPTQGSNPGLLHCRKVLYHLSHQGSHPGIGFCSFREQSCMHASSVHFSVTGKPAGREQQGFISTQGFGTD